jgi:uncharacterized protein (TIGR00730 family)
MTKNIAVFAGNGCSKARESYYFPIAYETGKVLAVNGYSLITGGGPGMMNEALKGAYDAGGHTIGILLDKKGKTYSSFIKESYSFPDLKPRQHKFLELADGFIAVPGGMGTLYEIVEIIALKRVDEVKPEVPLIVIDGYFDGLHSYFKHMIDEGFVDASLEKMVTFCASPQDAITVLNTYFSGLMPKNDAGRPANPIINS